MFCSTAIIQEHKTDIISENLEDHIEVHSYSVNNHATDRYSITDYYVSVVFTVNTTQLITEYLLHNPNNKLGIN